MISVHLSTVRCCIAALAAAALAACADHGATSPSPNDASRAADALDHLADSVAAVQGDGAAFEYHDAAWRIRMTRHVTPITLTIDGQPVAFSAVASAESLLADPCSASGTIGMGMPCLDQPFGMRSLIAWQTSDPTRVLMLTAAAEQGGIGPIDVTVLGSFLPPGLLRYTEGRDHLWTGTSGSYRSSMTVGDPCPPPPTAMPMALPVQPPSFVCHEAQFAWQLDAALGAPQSDWMFRYNAATGTRTISLARTSVAGTQMIMKLTRGMGLPGGMPMVPSPALLETTTTFH